MLTFSSSCSNDIVGRLSVVVRLSEDWNSLMAQPSLPFAQGLLVQAMAQCATLFHGVKKSIAFKIGNGALLHECIWLLTKLPGFCVS